MEPVVVRAHEGARYRGVEQQIVDRRARRECVLEARAEHVERIGLVVPALCADRLDYTLRDGIHGGVISRQRAREFLTSVVLKDGKIAVNAETEVAWINEAFEKLNNDVFRLPLHLYANGKMAELIKKFLNKGILVESDLFKTDTMLLNKIRTSYEGYEAIKSIKQLKGLAEFMRHGAVPKIKKRTLNALLV